jgi:hypothetical protein
MLGAFHRSGKTVVEKDVGNKVGFGMEGGEISIQGSTEDESGYSMTGGIIIVRGHSGDRLGCGMSGGSIVVMGSVGSEPGIGMTGGRVIISGSCPPPPDGVEMRSIKKSEISEFSKLLDPMGLALNDDALVLEAADGSLSRDDEAEVSSFRAKPMGSSNFENSEISDFFIDLISTPSGGGGQLPEIMTLPPVMPIPGSEPTEPITTIEPPDIPQPRRSPECPLTIIIPPVIE